MADCDPTIARWFERYSIPVTETGCWLFTKTMGSTGYGNAWVNGKTVGAHRYAYEIVNGKIPHGKMICHRCDVRLCVNPSHLYAGSTSENAMDSVSRGRHRNSPKTHCPQGHPYCGENLYRKSGNQRSCKACRYISVRKHRAKKKAR